MSAYAGDLRVPFANLLPGVPAAAVHCGDGQTRSVLLDHDAWLIGDADGRPQDRDVRFPTADEAIRSLIGDPQ